MPKSRPPYPAELRAERHRGCAPGAVERRPLREIAADLDVSQQTLRNWVFAAQVDAGEREGITTDEQEELRSRRRRVKVLEAERDILKKSGYATEWGARVLMRGGEGRGGQVTPPAWSSTRSRLWLKDRKP